MKRVVIGLIVAADNPFTPLPTSLIDTLGAIGIGSILPVNAGATSLWLH
jgi:hypothetical protein